MAMSVTAITGTEVVTLQKTLVVAVDTIAAFRLTITHALERSTIGRVLGRSRWWQFGIQRNRF